MPMKSSRRRNVQRDLCDLGTCRRPKNPHHHFTIDLHDGKPHITLHACSREHLEYMLIGHRRNVVHDG